MEKNKSDKPIGYYEAVQKVLERAERLGPEKLFIGDALDRVIDETITAGFDIPGADNSAMDGWALRAADIAGAEGDNPKRLKTIGVIPAGDSYADEVAAETAIKIMTGSPVPAGIDTVVKVEDSRTEGDEVLIFADPGPGANIRRAAEDISAGETIFEPGEVLRPGHIGMLASLGRPTVKVLRRPTVAILTTGDEIHDLGTQYKPGVIYNSNGYSLAAAVREIGGIPQMLGPIADDYNLTVEHLEICRQADVIITSGGISMGDYDFIKEATRKLEMDTVFYGCRIKPGKPTYFGIFGGTPFFGLPGNPVSSMVIFEVFVRPFLLQMSGSKKVFRDQIQATLKHDIKKKPGRLHFLRSVVTIDRDGAAEVAAPREQGSGILSSMVRSNSLLLFPEEKNILKQGEQATVLIIDPAVRSSALPPKA